MGFFSKKSFEAMERDGRAGAHHLKAILGPTQLMLLGIGAIIGAGLFSIIGIAAAESAGPAIVLSFIIAAIGCAFAGLCYSELAAMIPLAGSAYTYAYATLGELIAWMIGWTLVLEYAIGAATVSISWSAYAVSFLEDFNLVPPTWLIASPWQPVKLQDGTVEYGLINLPAIFIVVLMSYVLIRGIRQSSALNAVIVAIKVSIVLLFIAIGIFFINPENYHPFIPENTGTFGEFGWSGVLRAAAIVFFAYIGFDAVSTAAQETKDPKRSLPIGILGSLAICTVLYVVFALIITGMVHYTELDVAAPVAVAIDKTPFWWLNWLIKLAILAGFTSVILVMLLGQSRVFYAMSRDGLLPKLFSEIHPKFHTPWRCNLVLMLFVSLFSAFAPIELVGSLTSIGTLLAFVIVCAGVLVLRYSDPDRPRPFSTPLVPFTPIAGIVVCLVMMLSLGLDNWLRLIAWLVLGLVIYLFYGRSHSRLMNE